MSGINRRDFFKRLSVDNFKEKNKMALYIRPPYQPVEERFEESCPACEGFCVKACEENIIQISNEGLPHLKYDQSGCTFCGKCAEVCDKKVLNYSPDAKIMAQASIFQTMCLAWNLTLCNSCLDACEVRAIKFEGLWKPVILSDKCNGCGFCISICVGKAISIQPIQNTVTK